MSDPFQYPDECWGCDYRQDDGACCKVMGSPAYSARRLAQGQWPRNFVRTHAPIYEKGIKYDSVEAYLKAKGRPSIEEWTPYWNKINRPDGTEMPLEEMIQRDADAATDLENTLKRIWKETHPEKDI